MKKEDIIVVTGAAGFIGSCMVGFLNKKGFENLILVDDFTRENKQSNLEGKTFSTQIDRKDFFEWLDDETNIVHHVFHLGARTDTTEFDYDVHEKLNVVYSKNIWNYCTNKQIPLVYASSAATYGNGEFGYKDDHEIVDSLVPLNPYGVSKNEFDKWALQQTEQPPFWSGMKFFNVYGPNEYHKGRMASVIFHSFNQISTGGNVRLFKSHKEAFKDGEQLRDFIYVEDVLKLCFWIMEAKPASGLYNLGTGKARTFKDLVLAIFKSLKIEPDIEFIETPEDIRDKYQYFTEADMNKVREAGYTEEFKSLENAVDDYVQQFLVNKSYY
jgi:ADP-L-glycero-D-manno-heptose 6-epimerase